MKFLCAITLAATNVHTAYGMHAAGGALRGAPPAATKETKAAVSNATVVVAAVTKEKAPVSNSSDAVDAAMDIVNSIGASLHSAPPAAAAAPKTAAAPGKRAKLDVGFADFEQDVVAEVSRCVNGHLTSSEWTEAIRLKLIKSVTSMLHDGFKEELKPMKQSIGKTWMALPEDAQKDGYVEQLKSSFADTFSSTVERVGQHANTSLARLATTSSGSKASEAQLLVDGLKALNSSLLADHCYDEPKGFAANKAAKTKAALEKAQKDAKKPAAPVALHATQKEQKDAKKPAAAPVALQIADQADPAGQFCVKSLLHGFVHRLDDSQNLISMTMRFDARAMAMVQAGKQEAAAEATRRPFQL